MYLICRKVSGIRHKTPAEIQALEQGHGKGQGGSVKSRSPQSPPVISKTPNENLPTTNDWEILSKLTANGKGEYCLFVCNAAKSRILTLSLVSNSSYSILLLSGTFTGRMESVPVKQSNLTEENILRGTTN